MKVQTMTFGCMEDEINIIKVTFDMELVVCTYEEIVQVDKAAIFVCFFSSLKFENGKMLNIKEFKFVLHYIVDLDK